MRQFHGRDQEAAGGFETMIIENVLLFLGTLAAIGLGIVLWKKFEPSIKHVDLSQVDLSAPLRGRELLSSQGIFKLAYRWGVWKAVFMFWMLYGAIVGGTLYALSIWGVRHSTRWIVSYTFMCSTTTAIMLYRQITKALRVHAFARARKLLQGLPQ